MHVAGVLFFFFLFRACQETFLTRFLYPVRRRTALSSCNIWISGCDCAVRPRRCFSFVSSIRLRHLPIHCIRLLIFLCLTEQCCCGGNRTIFGRVKGLNRAAKPPKNLQPFSCLLCGFFDSQGYQLVDFIDIY